MPRIDKFEAPGPRLTPANAPQLFTIIEEVARATSQPRPEDVYLLGDVNAFVTQRGGFMGFGSRRVMGVGLPLLKGLSPAELRSVIAHEFGHFVSGDVALGPWIYKTRAAICRALEGQRQRPAMAVRLVRADVHAHDDADFAGAGVCGGCHGRARRRRGAGDQRLEARRVDRACLRQLPEQRGDARAAAGFLPPMGEGFDRYLADPDMAKLFQEYAKHVAGRGGWRIRFTSADAERIAALQRIKQKPSENPKDAKAVMLKEPERHIRALMEHMYGKEQVVKLKPISGRRLASKSTPACGRRW